MNGEGQAPSLIVEILIEKNGGRAGAPHPNHVP